MKRNLNENSTRSTAGCLPVPLFNQKKRTRQPLTSNPLKNDPGISTTSDSYDFPPLPTDWAWEAMNPELPPLTKTINTGYRDGNKNTSFKTWDRSDFRPQCKRTNLAANDGINSSPMNLGVQQQKQLKVSQLPNLSHQRECEVLRQTHSSKIPGSTMRGLERNSTLQAFKPNIQQNQFKKKMLGDIPEENALKDASLYQLKLKEKDNSLRIISAVIESMKYWREHAPKTVLLFEILGVLDSAVTPGPYYSKTFLMRDGKNTLPCVFYEIALKKNMAGQNQTAITEFLLQGLPIKSEQKNLFYALFLVMYVTTVLGNLLIIFLIRLDSQLHTPIPGELSPCGHGL
ncbi:spermatogenesis-associated protein 22 isoform X4 [Eptesicus fuscus]|uniref:spermatogenesis-associated protein 22 isoform X4 n=1 Tax=Eptesicus fuscus TaxID=29078 RepID=UPI0024047AEE|nr:spermatogenesis-associated protein 22 isoform X4 [Eptesicus fuscus]